MASQVAELGGCRGLTMVRHDHADLQDQLLGMLGLLGAVREGMEAGEELGDDASRETGREAEIRQKTRLKAW